MSKDESDNSHLFDTARFEQSQRVALAMASASLLPKHLDGNSSDPKIRVMQAQANCLRIVNQAVRWGFDPFAIMDETYVVSGKLGYQGKLVAAVVNARAGLKKRLSYAFAGKKGTDDFQVTVTGTFEDEDEPRSITLTVGQAKTNNDMWKKDPEQKLCYSGATKWARRWCPEIMLGVAIDDDLDRAVPTITALPAGSMDLRRNAIPAPSTNGHAADEMPVAKADEPPEPDAPEEEHPAAGGMMFPDEVQGAYSEGR